MKKIFKVTIFLAVAILLIGCTKEDDTNVDSTITLKSNPTTGYNWVYEVENTKIANIISEEYIADYHEELIDGGGGKTVFVIEPLMKGKTIITFKYMRSWEEEAIDEKVYEINVDNNLKLNIVEKGI